MADDKVRLGGMALANGVLVHGPTSWACAIRTEGGELEVAAGRKRVLGGPFAAPLLRGPARLLEALAIVPEVKRALPEARLPLEGARVLVSTVVSATALQVVRRTRLTAAAKELLAGLLTFAPAVLSLREEGVAAYHGAEHIAIGGYERGEAGTREHERCGTHLVGPLLLTATVGNVLAARVPPRLRPVARAAAAGGAVAASTELFAWMSRNQGHPLARALARPGYAFQQRVATAEPTAEQLDVAEAALRVCLELEQAAA